LVVNLFPSAPPFTFRLDFNTFIQLSHNCGEITQDTSTEYWWEISNHWIISLIKKVLSFSKLYHDIITSALLTATVQPMHVWPQSTAIYCSYAIDAILVDFSKTRGNHKIYFLLSLTYWARNRKNIHNTVNYSQNKPEILNKLDYFTADG
jgi:hypothetical protein